MTFGHRRGHPDGTSDTFGGRLGLLGLARLAGIVGLAGILWGVRLLYRLGLDRCLILCIGSVIGTGGRRGMWARDLPWRDVGVGFVGWPGMRLGRARIGLAASGSVG